MSRPRGSYIGGHTVIGPASGWFSRTKQKKKVFRPSAPLTPDEIAARQRIKAERRQAQEEQRRAKAERKQQQKGAAEAAAAAKAARKAAKLAALNSPEARAIGEAKAAARRLALAEKMARVIVIKKRLAPRSGPK
jgi:hypothetical protein